MPKFLPVIMPTSFDINRLQCFIPWIPLNSSLIQTAFRYEIKLLATNTNNQPICLGCCRGFFLALGTRSDPHLCKISYHTNFSHHIFHAPPPHMHFVNNSWSETMNLVTMAYVCSQVVGHNPISPTTAVYWWSFSICMPETKLKSQVYIHIFPTLPLSMILLTEHNFQTPLKKFCIQNFSHALAQEISVHTVFLAASVIALYFTLFLPKTIPRNMSYDCLQSFYVPPVFKSNLSIR